MLVIRERTGLIETLTLNRPEAANSLNPPLMAELGTALHEILLDVDIRAVVVTGAGERIFCAGMDLTALGGFDTDPETWEDPDGARTLFGFLDGSYEKPLIAAVNGAAVGGGLEVVMACDLVVAAEHARFGLPEVKRGLFAAAGAPDCPNGSPRPWRSRWDSPAGSSGPSAPPSSGWSTTWCRPPS